MERKVKQYGWVPDLPDARDHMYAAPQPVLATLPSKADLRPQCPPVLDQGALGSCTANAILGFYQVTRPLAAVAHCYTYTRELLGGFLVRPR
jgi:hypothetical protein